MKPPPRKPKRRTTFDQPKWDRSAKDPDVQYDLERDKRTAPKEK